MYTSSANLSARWVLLLRALLIVGSGTFYPSLRSRGVRAAPAEPPEAREAALRAPGAGEARAGLRSAVAAAARERSGDGTNSLTGLLGTPGAAADAGAGPAAGSASGTWAAGKLLGGSAGVHPEDEEALVMQDVLICDIFYNFKYAEALVSVVNSGGSRPGRDQPEEVRSGCYLVRTR